MSVKKWISTLAFAAGAIGAILASSGCAAQPAYNTERGAVLGGLGGAALGAIIGENNDNPLLGAAIGAGAGALAGGALGNTVDQENAYRSQQQQAYARSMMTAQDVVALHQAGTHPDVIVGQIRSAGIAKSLTTDEIIYLSQSGVSADVIRAMQNSVRVAAVGPPATRAVIVEEVYPAYRPVYLAPPPVYYHPHWHHRHHHHHHGHGHIGIGIGF
jgi:hypothetical protein